jgi:DNA polymerase
MKTYLIFDYETYSECDLKTSGAYEYARHPSTEILCVGYVYGTREELPTAEVRLLVPPSGNLASDEGFVRALLDPNTVIVAHNSFFEFVITRFVLPRYRRNLIGAGGVTKIPFKRWICTASLARYAGLPGKLAGAGAALGLKHQKDPEGHRVMLKLSQPRKPTKNNPDTRWTPRNAPADFEKLYSYCIDDTKSERELFLALPPLPPIERRIWLQDQRMNARGFAVDRELITGALYCIDRETRLLDRRFQDLTGLNSARQRQGMLDWLKAKGVVLPNLQAGTIEEYLKAPFRGPARKALEIRQAISKSSTSKYAAFEIGSRTDGRVRDTTIYHAAHTGRKAGARVQPQNLFKSTLKHDDVLVGIDLMRARDVTAIRALFPRPMELYASVLRSCIVAPKGKVLDVGDFATIEVRVLYWLAGHKKGLKALRDGEPIYSYMAAKIFDVDGDEIERLHKAGDKQGYRMRQLGKATVLGAGFGIGVGGEKFVGAAKALAGLDITLQLAQKCVAAYRQDNPQIVNFWDVIETCATNALKNPGKAYRHGFLTWRLEGKWLTCELPIGRKLYYFSPMIMKVKTLYGEKMALTYRSVDPKTKQFLRTTTWGGKLAENVTQAVARDLLMEALLRLEKSECPPVLDVHDEIVAEREGEPGSETPMFEIMAEVPAWAPGLPIKVEGWSETRYRK